MSFLESNNNERKALVRVLEIDSSGQFEKEVLGFGVKMKKNEETNSYMFITSSSVLRSSQWIREGSKIVADRYCSQYPSHIDHHDHREEVFKVISSVDDHVSFVFFKGLSEAGFLEVDDGTIYKTLPMLQTLRAYAFEGKELVELIFQDKHSNNDYKLATVSKRGFQVKTAKGAPVIAYDRLSGKPYVVGVLDIKIDGTLYPVFLTEENLEVKSEAKKPPESNDDDSQNPNNGKPDVNPKDEKDSPITNGDTEKPDLCPAGGGAEGNNGNEEKGKKDALVTDEPDRTIHPSDAPVPKQITVVTGYKIEKEEKISANVFQQKPKSVKFDTINEALTDKGKKPANVFQEESKCFKFNTISEALPDKLKRKLIIKLDPDRPLGGDIRSLADAYGYTLEEINYLKTLKHPTLELLQEQGNSTLLDLSDKLKKIAREDAAKLIDDYIKNNCDCEQCGNLR